MHALRFLVAFAFLAHDWLALGQGEGEGEDGEGEGEGEAECEGEDCPVEDAISAAAHMVANPCAHELLSNVRPPRPASDKDSFYSTIDRNATHLYQFVNYNYTQINQPDEYRKVIINLEPCEGVVYLFVRKTRRCYPNPYSCIHLDQSKNEPGSIPAPHNCEWTHFMSVVDGSRDGAPTFFEIPLSTTKFYVSVYAKESSRYTLSFLSDIGHMPRPGNFGDLTAIQMQYLQVQLSWDAATFIPHGISSVKQYWIYSSMLLKDDKRTNAAVFLTKNKIMNSVCGLKNNTHRAYGPPIPPENCQGNRCNATIQGVAQGKRYIFNVVAESDSGFEIAYAGLVLSAEWEIKNLAVSSKTLEAVGAIAGGVIGIVTLSYFWVIHLYK